MKNFLMTLRIMVINYHSSLYLTLLIDMFQTILKYTLKEIKYSMKLYYQN